MSSFLRTCTLLVAALLAVGPAVAATPADLEAQLRSKPINQDNWAYWSPRLLEWSNEDFDAARPAFEAAFSFAKKLKDAKPEEKKKPTWRPFEQDPVAWMCLAGLYLRPNPPSLVAAGKDADEAARAGIGRDRDKKLPRLHLYRCLAIRQQELTPHDKGGPTKHNPGHLQEALRELQAAREMAPGVQWMKPWEAGNLATRADKWDEAQVFYEEALRESPDDAELAHRLCNAVLGQNGARPHRGDSFTAVVGPVAQKFPKDPRLAADSILALAKDKRGLEAAAELEKVRTTNPDVVKQLPPNFVNDLDRVTASQRPSPAGAFFNSLFWWTVIFTIVYGSIMGLMCLTGWLLARRTRGPQATEILASDSGEMTSGGKVVRTKNETALARFYLVALITALVLFYLSLPFVFIGLMLVCVALVLCTFFIRRGTQGADVHSALMKASTGGIGAIFKATFARTGTGSYGLEKDAEECPKLWKAIEEVAQRVDTEAPDEVWISPGADFCVHQEGRGPFGVFGSRKRVLTLGLCVMNFLTVSELKSISAHEFAHFSHADTHWNRFLFQVTLSLRTAMREMARTGGWVTWVNPFYWFFFFYSKSYSILSAGFSRSREFLADRMACTLYGSDVFTVALRKVITDGSHFEMTVYQNIVRLLKQKKAFVNIYVAFRKYREEGMTEEDRRKLHKKLLKDDPSMFASHPTFQERLDAAKPLPPAVKSEKVPSLQLFESPDKMEQELTDFLTDLVARYMNV